MYMAQKWSLTHVLVLHNCGHAPIQVCTDMYIVCMWLCMYLYMLFWPSYRSCILTLCIAIWFRPKTTFWVYVPVKLTNVTFSYACLDNLQMSMYFYVFGILLYSIVLYCLLYSWSLHYQPIAWFFTVLIAWICAYIYVDMVPFNFHSPRALAHSTMPIVLRSHLHQYTWMCTYMYLCYD